MAKYNFYKLNPSDTVWYADTEYIGEILISFDKKKVFNFFTEDVPAKLTKEQWEIFKKENPILATLKAPTL
ncbi:MAG: hypothetical protein J6Y72_07000 [Bacteroidales bacterium]|nr:hypothetical protein [Bacteroidales bacterium]